MGSGVQGKRRSRLRLAGLVALLTALLVVASVQWRQGRMVSEVMLQSTDNWASNFYEIGTEYFRLRTAWAEAGLQPETWPDGTREALHLRLDIFASRVGLLEESHRRHAIGARPEVVVALRQVVDFVNRADAEFKQAELVGNDKGLAPLPEQLRAQEASVRLLTLNVAGIVAEAASEQAAVVERQNRVGMGLTVFLCLLTALFAGIAVRQLREAERRRERLELVADDLRAARHVAEQAARAKGNFLANMSHEIRTPLNAIIGLNHLLARDAADGLQRDRLAKVADAARHLLQVINGVLDLSKIEAGKMTVELQPFVPDEVLDQALQMVRAKAAEKGLELIVDSVHLPSQLVGDPTRLSQMLINLLANAVKFTDYGWIRLRAGLAGFEGDQCVVRFEVQDTGCGIPVELQSRLFENFEQGDSSATRRHGGTGLGLALTRRLAELMGGQAGLASQVGQGSMFWFTARLGLTAAGDLPVHVGRGLPGLTAMLVDDLAEAREPMAAQLQSLGISVESFADGFAAMSRLRDLALAGQVPDVLIIDRQMPGMDGLGVVDEARRILHGAMPVVLLLSVQDDQGKWMGDQDSGAGVVLYKPLTGMALAKAIAQSLRNPNGVNPPRSAEQADLQILRLHAGRRVLLAEDNLVNQVVALELLQAVGLVVETANDGVQAVALTSERHFDLVLMDMQMPVLDGIGATLAIRQRHHAARLPIVAMTANAFAEDQQRCLAAGMNDHLAKPVDPERLFKALLRWLPEAAEPEITPLPIQAGATEGRTSPPAGRWT